ncbi:MAG: M23 family metallopeptidase [Spirochaetota bacterium]|nr:M23 family metallopeptidase [Spirochaetota bacterium]
MRDKQYSHFILFVLSAMIFFVAGREHKTAELNRQIAAIKPEFISPLKEYRVTSEQGLRKNPLGGGNTAVHYGVDMNGSREVLAVKDGIVINHYPIDRRHKGHLIYGGLVEIQHDDGISTYGHLSKTFVKEGQELKQGDVIGIIGNTGLSTGIHLHFQYIKAEVWK